MRLINVAHARLDLTDWTVVTGYELNVPDSIPGKGRHHASTAPAADIASYQLGAEGRGSSRNCDLTTEYHLATKLRMRGVTPPLPTRLRVIYILSTHTS